MISDYHAKYFADELNSMAGCGVGKKFTYFAYTNEEDSLNLKKDDLILDEWFQKSHINTRDYKLMLFMLLVATTCQTSSGKATPGKSTALMKSSSSKCGT